jgi:hypothetical protein
MELGIELILDALWLGKSTKLGKDFSQELFLAFGHLSLITVFRHAK